MRAEDLLAAVFPAQAACRDNLAAGEDIEPPDHPLVFETVRDCLTEALDLAGLQELLRRIETGRVEVHARDTLQPSVFSHQILNAMPYAFLDDAPLEERRARAVALRRALPEDARDLGSLDPDVIRLEEAYAWPPVRDADELHDLMLTLGVLTEEDVAAHAHPGTDWQRWFHALTATGRARSLWLDGARCFWLAAERAGLVEAAYPSGRLEPPRSVVPDRYQALEMEEAVLELVRGRVECTGPFTPSDVAERLALPFATVLQAVVRLEGEGLVLRGRFRPPVGGTGDEEEFCDRRILARIHRGTIGRLRQEIEPVPVASFVRFLQEWQHTSPSSQLSGEGGVLEVIEQLQGFESAASAWESAILPARVKGYTPAMLDALCFSGEVVWGRFARRPGPNGVPAGLSRHGPITLALRDDLPWLLDRGSVEEQEQPLSGAAQEVLECLTDRGASFLPDIVAGVRRLPSEVEEALWQLVSAGQVTADGFGALRGLISGAAKRAQRTSRHRRRPRVRLHSSRWALLRGGPPADDPLEACAAQLLRRYGVVAHDLLAREPMAPPWSLLLRVYRRAEARGEVRGGRFLAGLVGEQFALPEAVEALRAVHKRPAAGSLVRLSACDPLNLVGILTPGARVPATMGNEVAYRDGVPVQPDIA